jgi:hypothetical protein
MKYKLIIPADILPYPEKFEITAAGILAKHFRCNALFIKRTAHKTADIVVDGVDWEIKSPTGGGKRNIQHQLSRAIKQSPNIVFDARRSKIHITKIYRELDKQFKMTKTLKRLILITKTGEVVEFFK